MMMMMMMMMILKSCIENSFNNCQNLTSNCTNKIFASFLISFGEPRGVRLLLSSVKKTLLPKILDTTQR